MQEMKAGFDKGQERRAFAPTQRCKGASFVSAGRSSGSAPMVRTRPRSMPHWQRSKPLTRSDGNCLPSIPWTPTSKGSATVDTLMTSLSVLSAARRKLERSWPLSNILDGHAEARVSPEKSGIQAASKGVTFLGYRIAAYTSCGAGRKSSRKGPAARSWRVRAGRPPVISACVCRERDNRVLQTERLWRPRHETAVLVSNSGTSDSDRARLQLEFRGFANYYAFADDVKRALGVLELVVFRSFIKTLALRHRTTRARTMKRLRRGTDYEVTSVVRGKLRQPNCGD